MPLLSILHAAGRLSTRGACDAMSLAAPQAAAALAALAALPPATPRTRAPRDAFFADADAARDARARQVCTLTSDGAARESHTLQG